MDLVKLGYSGEEALGMVKEYYPDKWEKIILNCISVIELCASVCKITNRLAFTKICSKTNDMAMIIELIAANYFLIIDNKLKEIEKIKSEQLQLGNQLIALENNTFISFDDKKTLRHFYLNKQNELQISIDLFLEKIKTESKNA